jgi:hypothetical protein
MTGSSVSRWWYGVAITTLLCVLLYALGSLFVLLGPSQPAGSDGELVVKVLSLAATVVALVLHVATPIYVGSFVLDWWYLSKSAATSPRLPAACSSSTGGTSRRVTLPGGRPPGGIYWCRS